jgi:hypothetical protein
MAELKTNEEELSDETIMDIELGLKDVRAGRTLTMSEVKRRMKMKGQHVQNLRSSNSRDRITNKERCYRRLTAQTRILVEEC